MCNLTISELNQDGDAIWRVDLQLILPALILAAAALCFLACIASVQRFRAWAAAARGAGGCKGNGDVEMRAIEDGSASLLRRAEANEDVHAEIEMHDVARGRAAEDVIPEGDAGGGVGEGDEGGGGGAAASNGGVRLNCDESRAAAFVAAGAAPLVNEEQQSARSVSASSRMAAGVAGAAARAIDVMLRPTDALMRAFDDDENPVDEDDGAGGAPGAHCR